MYRKGQAIKKACEIIDVEAKKQGASMYNYDHNKFDFFQIASSYSNYAEILTENKRFVIYNLWTAELFSEGRRIDSKLNQILQETKKLKPNIFHYFKIRQVLSTLSDIEEEINEIYTHTTPATR